MTMLAHLQELDDLIVEHTKPPVTSMLRNKLSLAVEEAEAYQASSDKQDHTLANQAETIATLQKENQNLRATNTPQPPDPGIWGAGGIENVI